MATATSLPAPPGMTSPGALSSAMRGQDLARNMFSYNIQATNPSTCAYPLQRRRQARPHSDSLGSFNIPPPNMTYYPSDGILFDPERTAARANPSASARPLCRLERPVHLSRSKQSVPGGHERQRRNPGSVVVALWGYFRRGPTTNFIFPNGSPMDPANPNWSVVNPATGLVWPWMKYLTMRPHPSVHPFFPLPGDGGGDVKNVESGRGLRNPAGGYFGNDSIWMDLGFPILTSPDGRKYKPMFASFITSQACKVDMNSAGNMLNTSGRPPPNASNKGTGPWEINPGQIVCRSEYPNLFKYRYRLERRRPGLGGQYARGLIGLLLGITTPIASLSSRRGPPTSTRCRC